MERSGRDLFKILSCLFLRDTDLPALLLSPAISAYAVINSRSTIIILLYCDMF
jgi:hypothetical protein